MGFLREYEVRTVLSRVQGVLPWPYALGGLGESLHLVRLVDT